MNKNQINNYILEAYTGKKKFLHQIPSKKERQNVT